MTTHAASLGTVTFVGAGPGDPELLTLKGQKALSSAALVVYAGSLVPETLLQYAHPAAETVNSAPLTLEETHYLMKEAVLQGKDVVRLHTGDTALYGALQEQAALLDRDGIPWRVIPGITAASAAAAAAGITFTVPEVTQSLIITRMEGRTPVPERERLHALAQHQTSLALYLSSQHVDAMQQELLSAFAPETPLLCAYRVGWPEERLLWTTVAGVADCVHQHNLHRQTIFLVLPGYNNNQAKPSRLYAADFSHEWRHVSKEEAS